MHELIIITRKVYVNMHQTLVTTCQRSEHMQIYNLTTPSRCVIKSVNICATNLVKILETSGDEINGKFINLLKNEIPW